MSRRRPFLRTAAIALALGIATACTAAVATFGRAAIPESGARVPAPPPSVLLDY